MAAKSLWPTEPERPLSLHRHHPAGVAKGSKGLQPKAVLVPSNTNPHERASPQRSSSRALNPEVDFRTMKVLNRISS